MSFKGAKKRICQSCDATFFTAVGMSICRACRECSKCVKLKKRIKELESQLRLSD
jgi:hypothetical protein